MADIKVTTNEQANTPQGVAHIGTEHEVYYESATDKQKEMVDAVLSLLSNLKTSDVDDILFRARKEAPYRSVMSAVKA